MSILSATPSTATRETVLARRVIEIKSAPKRLTREMLRLWTDAFDALWEPEVIGDETITVSDKLAALGTDGKEIFEINTAFTAFMLSQLTGKRDDFVAKMNAKLATIPAHTINADGTVTLNS
jgi:hypothetical protein